MSDEAIRELFRIFVEEGELDEEQAERIIHMCYYLISIMDTYQC